MSHENDYEKLLASLGEGRVDGRTEAVLQLQNMLVVDRKRFSYFARRVLLAMEGCLGESARELNRHSSSLVLEVLNQFPRESEQVVRQKLAPLVVANLGNESPIVRKFSHQFLLAFNKLFRSSDFLAALYLAHGVANPDWAVRQKSLHSFQSLMLMDYKSFNWNCPESQNLFREIMNRL
jgi:hypothetical protein